MCIICIELEKSLIAPLEARRNLSEVSETLTLEHLIRVEERIKKIENKNQFIMLLREDNTVELCTECHCNRCDCDWGTSE
jgi:hypothetical protein